MRNPFQQTVYAKLHPDRLSLLHVQSGRTLIEPPLAAIATEPKRQLLCVGAEAQTLGQGQGVLIVNPFKHPRTLLHDFTVGELVLRALIRKLLQLKFFSPSPIVIVHPLVNPEGGFTQIEIRALRELAIGAGAARAIIWHGRELISHELQTLQFPRDGELLE